MHELIKVGFNSVPVRGFEEPGNRRVKNQSLPTESAHKQSEAFPRALHPLLNPLPYIVLPQLLQYRLKCLIKWKYRESISTLWIEHKCTSCYFRFDVQSQYGLSVSSFRNNLTPMLKEHLE